MVVEEDGRSLIEGDSVFCIVDRGFVLVPLEPKVREFLSLHSPHYMYRPVGTAIIQEAMPNSGNNWSLNRA